MSGSHTLAKSSKEIEEQADKLLEAIQDLVRKRMRQFSFSREKMADFVGVSLPTFRKMMSGDHDQVRSASVHSFSRALDAVGELDTFIIHMGVASLRKMNDALPTSAIEDVLAMLDPLDRKYADDAGPMLNNMAIINKVLMHHVHETSASEVARKVGCSPPVIGNLIGGNREKVGNTRFGAYLAFMASMGIAEPVTKATLSRVHSNTNHIKNPGRIESSTSVSVTESFDGPSV